MEELPVVCAVCREELRYSKLLGRLIERATGDLHFIRSGTMCPVLAGLERVTQGGTREGEHDGHDPVGGRPARRG